MLRWILGGLIGGAIGIAIWILVGYLADYEVGWIAWGVGFLSGFGVRYAAHLGDQEESTSQGVVAAGIACGSIIAAKFLLYCIVISGSDAAEIREFVNELQFDDESMIVGLADEIAKERIDRGQSINWPPGMSYDEALQKVDYPAEIWQEAEARWEQLGEAGQQQRTQQRAVAITALAQAIAPPRFSDFFSAWDLLWFGLAMVTAFRVGVGSYGGD